MGHLFVEIEEEIPERNLALCRSIAKRLCHQAPFAECTADELTDYLFPVGLRLLADGSSYFTEQAFNPAPGQIT